MPFFSGEGQITKLQDYEFTEATELGASSRLRNYEITSLQRPLIWEPARDYEITRLRADRCLFISGEGQITKLQDYELTESNSILSIESSDSISILQNKYFLSNHCEKRLTPNYEITKLRHYQHLFLTLLAYN